MADRYQNFPSSKESPIDFVFDITANNSANLAYTTRAIYIGNGGNIQLETVGNNTTVILKNVVAGTILPLRVRKVYANNTTANSIVGMY